MSESKQLSSDEDVKENIEHFLIDLRKKVFKNSTEIACETIKLLEKIITNSEWETAKDLMNIMRNVGKKLNDTSVHTVVSNMVKRVLKIIRDEYSTALGKTEEYDQQESLQKMLVAEEAMDFAEKLSTLKRSIAANLRELMEEYERSSQDIALQSEQHIRSNDMIMTFGYSRTVEKFLKRSATKRTFVVVIAEAFPSLSGHNLAKSLAESNIETILIQDTAIAAMMEKVNKVIVGAHCVFRNGGLKTTAGIHTMAICARYCSVPFIVLSSMYKITPQYVTSSDQVGFNLMNPPEDVISFEDDELLKGVEIINNAYDYVEPELVDLFIFNSGDNTPSYVYRLIQEMYHADDYELIF